MTEEFLDFLDEGRYEYRDVEVEGRRHCAVRWEDRIVLMPVNLKFGGIPFFEVSAAREITEEELARLSAVSTKKAE